MSEDPAMLRSFTHDGPVGAPTPPDRAPEEPSDASWNPRPSATAMSRPRTGHLRRTSGGSWGVEFSLRGEKHWHPFEGSESWDRETACAEQRYLMEKVNRGEWAPPAPAEPPSRNVRAPLYRDFAAACLARWTRRLDDPDGKTAADLEWRLSVGMAVFGPRPVDRVDEALAEDLVDALRSQRLAIEHALELGRPLMEDYVDPRTGRTHRRRRRGLANSSINKALAAAERVLRDAYRRRLIERVPDLRSAALKAERPKRSFLEPVELAVVFAAADALEAANRGLTWEKVVYIRGSDASAVALGRELGVSDTLIRKVRRGELWNGRPGKPNRNDVARRAVVETLALLGPRVSELCALDGHDADLAAHRVRIPRDATKTDAGERVVPILPALRERMIEHKARWPYGPTEPIFATRNGTRNTANNVLSRIVAPVHARANELLEQQGRPPIAHLTPHTFRRTFASILALCRVDPRRAMYLLGHTDSRFTLRVYQQVLDAAPGSLDVLERLMGCSREQAREILESGEVSQPGRRRILRTSSEQGQSLSPEATGEPSVDG
jgi:integrase